jgi:hypothetical protein
MLSDDVSCGPRPMGTVPSSSRQQPQMITAIYIAKEGICIGNVGSLIPFPSVRRVLHINRGDRVVCGTDRAYDTIKLNNSLTSPE